jgi:HD-GYP domain-containing protein (c-di-GMP phosphodiesterase class II)
MLKALYSNYRATLRALACTIEARDYETGGHSDRVVVFSLRLGIELGLSGTDLVGLEQGALLHDIGKIGVPDAVLQKKGPLTAEEWQEMKRHPIDGLRILEGIDFLASARPVVAQHHEKYDGSGYPAALRGDAIHLYARIFAVADAFDAITSDRPYHLAESYETARKRISEGSGGHFDPEIVAAFLRVSEEEWHRLRESSGAPGYAEKVIDKEQIHSFILSLTTLVGPSPIETRAEAAPCADQGFPQGDGKLTVAISGLSSGSVNR